MIVADHQWSMFQRVRDYLSVTILPVQALVNQPIKAIHSIATGISTYKRLLEENAELRTRELLLTAQLNEMLMLQKENTQLKQLLQAGSALNGRLEIARLLAVDLNPSVLQVIINKGSQDGVAVGQAVLDAYGVLGQVVSVGPLTSKVLLITDERFAIPVQNYRTGIRSVAMGLGDSNDLHLMNVIDTGDMKVGDLLLASGLGLHFPTGYPVGVIKSIGQVQGEKFVSVLITPSAHFNKTQLVLLVWPKNPVVSKPTVKPVKKRSEKSNEKSS
jgi:rod shape-determining protein MreC